MKRFRMQRQTDVTGVSGTGHIADGVVFDDGTVVVRWRTATPGTTAFASLDHAKAVHAHDGKTQFLMLDDDYGKGETMFCAKCFADDDIVGHCLNCGSGGTTIAIPTWAVEEIRRSATWVGKRYYPDEEDLETRRELRELRALAPTLPGRVVEAASDYVVGNGPPKWVVTQSKPGGGAVSTLVTKEPGETAEQALRRTADVLPVYPSLAK